MWLILPQQTDIIQERPLPVGPMIDHKNYSMRPLEDRDARAILLWRYERPYNFYNPPENNKQDYYVAQFLDPELMFHVIVDLADNLVGFCSFGTDGQVTGGDYTADALDIGLGMKPELTGQGRGREFFWTILEHTQTFSPPRVRLTVATFNERAMQLYRRFGFEEVEQFIDVFLDVPYTVMVLDC